MDASDRDKSKALAEKIWGILEGSTYGVIGSALTHVTAFYAMKVGARMTIKERMSIVNAMEEEARAIVRDVSRMRYSSKKED